MLKILFLYILISSSICDNSKKIRDFLKSKGLSKVGIASIMGNLYAESQLNPNSYDKLGQRKTGLSITEYIRKTNDGTYTNFEKDSIGFGIAHWTHWSKKKKLLENCEGIISDLDCQLNFLFSEIENDISFYTFLKEANDLVETCDIVFSFLKPTNKEFDKKRRLHCKRFL